MSRYRPSHLQYYLLLLLLTFLLHNHHDLNSDEGFVLAGAWELFNGRQPYTDFFTYIPPGSYYIIYWLWQLFSPEFALAKGVAITSITVSAIGIHRLALHYVGQRLALIPPLLFTLSTVFWPIINHHVFSLLFIVWAINAYISNLFHPAGWKLPISGLLLGVSALFLIHKAIVIGFVLLMTSIYLQATRLQGCSAREMALFCLGLVMPGALTTLSWPADLLFNELIAFPARHYLGVNSGLANYTLLLFALAAVIVAHAALKQQGANYKHHTLFTIQYALLALSLQLPDYYHISAMLFPLYVLYAVTHLPGNHAGSRLTINTVYIGAFAIVGVIAYSNRYYWSYTPDMFSENPLITELSSECRESAHLYAGPFLPGLYFEMRKQNPSRHTLYLTGFNTDAHTQDIARALMESNPGCIVVNYRMVAKYNYERNNSVDHYIDDHYEVMRDFNGLLLLKPVQPATE